METSTNFFLTCNLLLKIFSLFLFSSPSCLLDHVLWGINLRARCFPVIDICQAGQFINRFPNMMSDIFFWEKLYGALSRISGERQYSAEDNAFADISSLLSLLPLQSSISILSCLAITHCLPLFVPREINRKSDRQMNKWFNFSSTGGTRKGSKHTTRCL